MLLRCLIKIPQECFKTFVKTFVKKVFKIHMTRRTSIKYNIMLVLIDFCVILTKTNKQTHKSKKKTCKRHCRSSDF